MLVKPGNLISIEFVRFRIENWTINFERRTKLRLEGKTWGMGIGKVEL